MNDDDNIYEVTWRLPFWGIVDEGLVGAPDLETAIERVPDVSADFLPLHKVSGPDGSVIFHDEETELCQVDFLMEVDGVLVEESVVATNFRGALDLLVALVGPFAEMRGVHAGGRRLWLSAAPDDFWDRPDIPTEWAHAA